MVDDIAIADGSISGTLSTASHESASSSPSVNGN